MVDIESLRNHCLNKTGVTEDMPFGEDVLAFRVAEKIFALTNLNQSELSVNLKAPPEQIISWREQFPDSVLPGYHMNKKHWNTVFPNRGLPAGDFYKMVDTSYQAVYNGLSGKVKKELAGES